mgnify:CR=1 FL=1
MKELQRRGDPNVVIALAGNKSDMEAKRKVQTEEAQQYAQENDIIFLETSAKTALNVKNLFVEIGKLKNISYAVSYFLNICYIFFSFSFTIFFSLHSCSQSNLCFCILHLYNRF